LTNPIVHFEIPAEKPKKLVDFYSHVFAWQIEAMAGTSDYWTVDTDVDGAPNGGILKKSVPSQAALNYVKVDSVEEHSKKVERRGGRVVHQRTAIPGIGWFAIGADPEGNLFGLFEEDPSAAMPPA